jgi:hypothetical protein
MLADVEYVHSLLRSSQLSRCNPQLDLHYVAAQSVNHVHGQSSHDRSFIRADISCGEDSSSAWLTSRLVPRWGQRQHPVWLPPWLDQRWGQAQVPRLSHAPWNKNWEARHRKVISPTCSGVLLTRIASASATFLIALNGWHYDYPDYGDANSRARQPSSSTHVIIAATATPSCIAWPSAC